MRWLVILHLMVLVVRLRALNPVLFAGLQGDIVIAFAQVHSLASMIAMFDKELVEHFMGLLRDCISKVLGEADGCVIEA